MQRLDQGTVTSFGLALQEVAKVFSEGTGVEGADVLKNRSGQRYHIQVKSGPNTMPKDMAVRITELLRSAQRRNRRSIALLGMCYGSAQQVSNIVRKYLGVDWLVGREFWQFISGDQRCIDTIYKLAREVGESYRDEQGQTLQQIVENKIEELTVEFTRLYGRGGNRMWKQLLDKNC
ncbi:MAG: PmeII family type II restriction endonuclease [Gemmatales bacterium]|nr:PmeII family type II restriction endonuclease [Gemmatales bacterium]MDW8175706.1 PmeII family type II restriction endonuclease [Gemmatales bacterium]